MRSMTTSQNLDAAVASAQAESNSTGPGPASVVRAAAQAGPPFVAALPSSGALLLTGSDARSFLQGQLANDVNGIQAGEAGRSLLLNHRGHAMAEAAVVRVADGMLCVVDDDRLEWVAETLERHIVFDDVELARPAVAVLTLQGSRATETLAAAGFAGPGVAGDDGVHVYQSRRSAAGGFDLAVIGGDIDELLAQLVRAGAAAASDEDLATARVAALIPTAAGEGGAGVLPQEAGLEPLISYRKGCYLGQEMMARIEARGNLRRELAVLQLSEAPTLAAELSSNGEAQSRQPAPGSQHGSAADQRTIFADGKKVGVLGTVAQMPDGTTRALCVLRREVEPTTELSVAGVRANRLAISTPIMPV